MQGVILFESRLALMVLCLINYDYQAGMDSNTTVTRSMAQPVWLSVWRLNLLNYRMLESWRWDEMISALEVVSIQGNNWNNMLKSHIYEWLYAQHRIECIAWWCSQWDIDPLYIYSFMYPIRPNNYGRMLSFGRKQFLRTYCFQHARKPLFQYCQECQERAHNSCNSNTILTIHSFRQLDILLKSRAPSPWAMIQPMRLKPSIPCPALCKAQHSARPGPLQLMRSSYWLCLRAATPLIE
jgi:hypothetical protein